MRGLKPTLIADQALNDEAAVSGRSRRLRLAVVSSLASKFGTIVVLLVSLPLAKHSLGVEDFAFFVVLSNLANWTMVANVGVGPGLATEIAALGSGAQDGYETKVRRLLTSSVVVVAVLGAALLAIAYVSFQFVDIRLPESLDGLGEERSAAILGIVIVLVFLRSLVEVVEPARLGLQEHHFNNLWGGVGVLLTAVALVACAASSAPLEAFVIALFAAPLLAKVLGAGAFFRQHRALTPEPSQYDRTAATSILKRNASHTLVQVIVFGVQQAAILLVASNSSAAALSAFLILDGLATAGQGMLSSAVQPLAPMVREAVASKDEGWARRSYLRLLKASLVYGLLGAAVLATIVPFLISTVYGADVKPARNLALAAGALFLVRCVEYSIHMVNASLDSPSVTALSQSVRGLLLGTVWLLFSNQLGPVGVTYAMAVSVLLVTVPWMGRRNQLLLDGHIFLKRAALRTSPDGHGVDPRLTEES